jgi:uncharacterized repeat protein (TIGR02543 family)
VSFGLVRMKVNAARPKIVSFVIATLISGLLVSIPVPANAAACVPTSTSLSNGDTVLTFSTVGSCDWQVPAGVTSARVLVVGGGSSGGGGVAGIWWPQGGGGGAVVANESFTLTQGAVVAVAVGKGGNAVTTQPTNGSVSVTTTANNGGNSSFASISANGGTAPNNTQSRGGTSGNGNLGGVSGGGYSSGSGGGAGGVGSGVNGGVGVNSDISGATVMYGSGGAGSNGGTGTASSGGGTNGNPPTVNRGGGGSQPSNGTGTASAGAAGVVIVRFVAPFTVTFNANGGTGTASAATVTQSAIGSSIILASTGTLVRSGYTHSGWNTQANGLGTDYASGATITPSDSFILYARWVSTITYSGNSNSGGTAPDPTVAVSSAAITKLADNTGSLVRSGFTFAGWNTAANGSGTTYGAGNPAAVSDTPYMHFDAADFNDSTNAWTDKSGNSRSIPGTAVTSASAGYIRGNPIKLTNTSGANGAINSFPFVQGTTADGILIGNEQLNNYTFCHVARFAGATRSRIFAGVTGNWLSGYWYSSSGVAHPGGWITTSSGGNDTNWKVICHVGGTKSGLRSNGVDKTTATNNTTAMPANISINMQGGRQTPNATEISDWAVAEMYIFNSILSDAKILELEAILKGKYGITDLTSSLSTINYASTGNTTLYAQWNSTITYNGNGQTSAANTVPGATTAKGSTNTTLAVNGTMAKTNYSFAGWNTQADGLGTNYASGLTTYQSTGNTTLYAKWTRTITYNSNGANSGAPERATDVFVNSTTPSISTFPTIGTMVKTGYTFAGWSTTTSGTALTTPYAAATEIPLYARWTANTYAVTYDTSTVTSGTMANTSLTAGTAFTLRANAFTRTGFSFKNWNTSSNGSGTTYAAGASVTLYSDLTLYPQWNLLAPSVGTLAATAGNTEVTLTPSPAAASSTVGATTSVTITAYTSQSTVSVFNPSKTCTVVAPATSCVISGLTNGTIYYFKSVATNATGSSTLATYTPASPAGVAVTYNASANSGIIGTSGTTGTLNATFNKGTPLTLPVASKTGYIFSGWYTTQSSGGALVGAAGATYSPTTAITLFARYSGIVYTINYNGNGNTGGTVPNTGSYEFGSDGTYNNTQVYTYTGADQTFTVPNDITGTKEILVEVWGAGGGGTVAYYGPDYGGGAGGYTKATISTATAGDQLTLKVGKGGTVRTTTSAYGGAGVGGNTSGLEGSSGGGYSGVFAGTTPLAISGGGGGASPGHDSAGIAGGGGGANQSGTASTSTTAGGRGGSTSAGGAKAASCATDGAQYTGGNGCGAGAEAGGGGGAGYYGGGGGSSNGQSNGGGGGGSGYLDATRGSLITATVGQIGALSSTWAFPNKTSSNYGSDNAGRGGKSNTNTTADSGGGNGRIVIQWKTGSGAHVVGAGPTKVGYTFAGWTTNADGSGTTYQPNASLAPSANVNLFAKWTANTNTITYNANTGSGSVPTSGSYVSGAATPYTVLSKPNDLTKTGSEFIGWNTAANGTGTGYSTGASLTTVENAILYAQWRESTYSYSYQLNGGTSTQPESGTAIYNASITLPTAPTRTGFTFAGWNNGTSTISLSTTSVNITANSIFVAQWTAQSFTISFDGNSAFGGVNTSGSVASGTFVAGGIPYSIAANGFTKAGYNFDGWKNSAGTSFVVGSGYSTAANLALIAQWTPASYTITYNANGATSGTAPSAATLTTGTPFSASTNSGTLVKTGYEFAGWNTSAAGTGANIAINGVVTTTTNLTLFAKWTVISPTITYLQGQVAPSVNSGATVPSQKTAAFGTEYTLEISPTLTVTVSGTTYSFVGWASGGITYQPQSKYRMSTADLQFTAIWQKVLQVRYVLNGGIQSSPNEEFDADCTVFPDYQCGTRTVVTGSGASETSTVTTNLTITLNTSPSRAGYTFLGWRTQGMATGATPLAGGASYTLDENNYIFYAQWSAIARTLSFNENGGSTTQASVSNKIIGDIEVLPTPTFTRTGYTFGGWSDGTSTYAAGGSFTVGNADQAFTAVWVGNTNTIFYNGNGATGGTAPDNGSQATGAAYTVASNRPSPNTLVKTGFDFVGWNTNANGTGTDYVGGATGLATTSNVTLYAKWTGVSSAVTYVTGVGASVAPTQSNTMYGSAFTLPTAPTQTGFNFLGWETGSGADATVYAPGSSYTMGASATTFTAKWSGLSYVVVYLLNGGSGTAPIQADVSHGQDFTTAAAPTRNGFTFTGWSDGATVINPSTPTLVSNVTSNKTLTAQWTIAVPGIPGTPTAAPGNGSATITIVAPTTGGTPSSYTVTAYDPSNQSAGTCTVTAPGTSCTIAPLTNGTAYTFTSTATNTAGTSTSASTASAAATPAGVPLSPSSITGSGLGASTTISWTAPTSDGGSPITDYVIEYSVAGSGTWTTFSDGTSTATSATITGLTAGNAYEFRVSAKNLIGNSLPSFTSPVVEALPTTPAIASVTGASEKVTVTWNAPSHLGSGTLTDYEVTAYDAAGNVAGSCNPASGQLTCEVTGLSNGSNYTFKVAAITTVGSSEQSSASTVVVPAGVPSAPANVVAVTSGSNMTLTFDAPVDTGGSAITSYVVTSSPAGATCTVGANATTYTCTGLTAGTNYSYSVKAVNSKGQSSASLDSTAVTAVAAPSAPLNVSAVITAGSTTLSATVSFDAPATNNGSDVTSYTATASPGGATCTVTAPTTYCDIPVLPDRVYTFTVTATNAVGTSVASTTTLEIKATNGIAPTLVVDPIPAPTGDLVENKVLSSNITFADFNSTPNSVVTYQWKSCTNPLDETTCTSISGATSATYTLTTDDVFKHIRVEVTATNSIGTITKLSNATEAVLGAPTTTAPTTPSTPSTPSTPVVDPTPVAPTCDSACQSIRDAAATKAAADAAAKSAADKAATDAAAKLKADADARTASNNASAAAKAAADAARTAVERAGAAAAAKAAADAAAVAAAAQAKAAADAQAAANRAAAAAQAALRNSAASAAAKAAATASANKAAANAQAAVRAAATAAQNATRAKTAETNANKQVDIAINSLTSRTASAQATAEANAIAAAAKTAANEAAAAAAARATEARATAATAQKAASDAAARIATEQRAAATAAAAAKAATEAAAKASAEKIAATNAEKVATETLVKVLNEKAALAEQAANATDTKAREEIAKKIEEIETRLDEVKAAVEEAQDAAEEATAEYEEASDAAAEAQETAAEKAQDAVDVKAEVATKTAAATKAAANATVAAKVATAAKAAAAKVPSKAVIAPKPSTSTNKNSAKATVTGLKPGQKVKVTVNVKPRP